MNQTHFRLSIEELAFTMGVLGGADVGSGFLMAILGERSQQEIEGRLLAASHSLVSRGYLDFDLESGTKHLDEKLGDVVEVLLQNDFSIRCSRSAGDTEQILNYFFRGHTILEHQIVKEVVSFLGIVPTANVVVKNSGEFFDLPGEDASGNQDITVATLPVGDLERIKDLVSSSSKEQAASLLIEDGVPVEIAQEITNDFSDPEYRGSVIKVESQEGQMVSNQGFLLLKSPRRFWIFEIVPQDPPLARVFRGTPRRYRDLFQALLK